MDTEQLFIGIVAWVGACVIGTGIGVFLARLYLKIQSEGIMFRLFSALKPGHITANSNSSPPININYDKVAIRWYCDAAIERLTLAQLDRLDENPLASEDHLQEGINFIKKLRASI